MVRILTVRAIRVAAAAAAHHVAVQLVTRFGNFFGVGIAAAIAHYAVLIGLVESGLAGVLPATLSGYLLGGVVSYALNRRHTYRSDRPHAEAGWRFAVVAGVGFLLTALCMHLMVSSAHLPYLPAQLLTSGIVLVWSFIAHGCWTFAPATPPA